MITKTQVDLWQGDHEINPSVKFGGRSFGYIHGENGGYFFTWHDSLDATIESLEVDEIDGDGDLDLAELQAFLRDYLPTTSRGRSAWEG